MNWIIQHTDKLDFHTDLKALLKPILSEIESFKWLISDFQFISDKTLPIHHEKDFFDLTSKEFNEILNSNTQLIWGVLSGFSENEQISFDENNLPFADGNDLIWKNGNFQVPNSTIEIIAFDSSYTIIKFKDKNLSDKFKPYFDEAIELEKFQ
ncbi:hypothetical protein DBB36_07485 [Flavobacterium sp. WLB]|uniref:hypothetical protein n=1 Tax=unclassified Flavobacterium TaxID=196869 RepID=UPI0006ABE740|nr:MULTISPECIES: hypothetical protein [unclassified Flavobacterium]OWU90259.1 hypothetical protein APR43_14380 [Flavobacterium sp. NLM]PUU70674.1 hypothetical protein DBB36_07485 [Flavobacterium sp. WLB]